MKLKYSQALHRGKYAAANGLVGANGIGVDEYSIRLIYASRAALRSQLIKESSAGHIFFINGKFSQHSYDSYIKENGIEMPLTPAGKNFSHARRNLKAFANGNVDLEDLCSLDEFLSSLRSNRLLETIANGRSHYCYTPFVARSARDGISSSKSVLAQVGWVKRLAAPPLGQSLVELDIVSEEWGIAALKSGDANAISDYYSGDAYIAAAVRMGYLGQGATKAEFPEFREEIKVVCLGILYSLGIESISRKLKCSYTRARVLLDRFNDAYHQMIQYLDLVSDVAFLGGRLESEFGWPITFTDVSFDSIAKASRTARNFPIQSAGAEIIHLAVVLMQSAGLKVLAHVHDSILVECRTEECEYVATLARELLVLASQHVLGGEGLIVDKANITHYPDRLGLDKGAAMWDFLARNLGLDPERIHQ